jgi:hypothetical protein
MEKEDLIFISLEEGRPPPPLLTPAAAAEASGDGDASACEKHDRALKTALRVRTC